MNITTFCPECSEETCVVEIKESGSWNDAEFGTIRWWRGEGKCQCGFQGEMEDQDK